MDFAPIKDRTTEALRWWEPRRLIYNVVLAAEVILYYFQNLPRSRTGLNADTVLLIFVLAVLANVCYCAAYAVDLFVQSSGLREKWRLYRIGLLAVGILFASVLTRWFAIALFSAF